AAPSGGPSGAAPAADIGAAAPSGARPAAFANSSVPAPRSGITRNIADGGHSPSPSLASRFDGSPERPRSAPEVLAGGMKGLTDGDGGGLPHLTPHDPFARAPGAAGAPLKDRTAASAVPGASGAPANAPGAKPEDEDYSYTYLAPTTHKYELPTDRPKDADDWRYAADMGLRASAVLALIYLAYHSDLPYLVGVTRKRKKNGAKEPASKIV
ncbi:MAG: hypothetical protein KGL74_07000, partial [Elusimicrobia bacterium]|nr:hypothetical protein [Elusimicrobiota bacterium]